MIDPKDDILKIAAKWKDSKKDVAIATVISTWGSSPRPVGSQLVVDGDGHFEGSVSGGCIEGAVIEAAYRTIETGIADVLDFGISNDQAWEVGLACGGNIRIFVEKVE
tara:strand:- start:100 stop:423 length:324 start_codon:yes stop_codon:yes gene_type:complete